MSESFFVPASPRILVVDDDALVRLSVSDILTDSGYAASSVESAAEALERLAQSPVEILITDVTMEGMSGIELIRELPSACPRALAIVMTGYASKEVAIEALRAGAHDLLEKPITPRLVLKAVERAWELLRTSLENRRLVEELKTSNRRLEELRAAAEASSEERGALLARISHEFRTPLNGIVGCHSLLRASNLDEKQIRFLSGAETATQELLDLFQLVEQDRKE